MQSAHVPTVGCGKKNRSDQSHLIDDLIRSILEGEAVGDAKRHQTPEKILAEQEARKSRRERGLNKIENLDVFATWYAFGGMEHGLSWRDAAEMDAADRDDCRFLLSELGHGRKERDKKKADLPDAPKPRRMNPRR